ncbi:hypothetical protein G6F16_010370 [Rhizopus arrhizus]|nr:hypothetical protein G6F24_003369 [Rhizopus arrhizus]KAG0814470.1 hypothetical protein G6F20_004755 [Rhizopus arrhizus]KAG0843695.1 hypothetical protein G6F19_000354 [Rhizopus arrhizus]KAG0856095.1 hypothetical protein G6F17_004896 [Rhizopus arrhizus]KAG0865267.1 hypothetical protein G6F16_010370 [Rhizopus arrhizus]
MIRRCSTTVNMAKAYGALIPIWHEDVKSEVKRVARSFGRRQASWRQAHLTRLQNKLIRLLMSTEANGKLVCYHKHTNAEEAKVS